MQARGSNGWFSVNHVEVDSVTIRDRSLGVETRISILSRRTPSSGNAPIVIEGTEDEVVQLLRDILSKIKGGLQADMIVAADTGKRIRKRIPEKGVGNV